MIPPRQHYKAPKQRGKLRKNAARVPSWSGLEKHRGGGIAAWRHTKKTVFYVYGRKVLELMKLLFGRNVGIAPANAPSATAVHRMRRLLLYSPALVRSCLCPLLSFLPKCSRRKVDLSSLKQTHAGTKAASGSGGSGGGRRVLPDGRGGFTIATTPQPQIANNSKRSPGVKGGGGRGAAVATAAATIPAVYREAGFSVSVSNLPLPSGKKRNGSSGRGRGAGGVKGKNGPAYQQQQQQNWRGKGATKAKGLSSGGGGGGGGAQEERSLEDLMFGGLAAVRR